MFHTIIVQPLYNILVAFYGIIPGHDLGVSIIIFTVLIRLLMWPLLKKQLHQSKIMRDLQPELKRVKKAAAGNKQKEGVLMMELYKEKGISPFSSIGLTLIQLPLFIGVFDAARNLSEHTDKIGSTTYSFVRSIPHVHQVIVNPETFNFHTFGIIDLSQKAFSNGKVYIPILVLAIAATIFQYIQSKQIMPQPKEKKKLRDILKASANGTQPASEDMTAAMTGSMLFLMPIMTLMFALFAQGAMVIYLLASSLIGIFQQSLIFKTDTDEMEAEVVSVKKQRVSEEETPQPTIEAPVEPKNEPKPGKVKKGKVTTTTRIIAPRSAPATKSKNRKRRKR